MKKLQTFCAVVAMTGSSALWAHGDMGKTYPQDGAMMMESTDRLEVHFEMPMKLVSLKLIDSSGKPVNIDFKRTPESAKHFKVPVSNLKPDTYKVEWKSMGGDGHMMKGSYGFMQH